MNLKDRLILILKVIGTPEIYMMILRIYLPLLFPFTFIMGYLARSLDKRFGLRNIVSSPFNLIAGILLILIGLFIVGLAYSYLVFKGGGSPSPFVKHTTKLVNEGIYAVCRNPSIWGKLAGVMGFGFLINSPVFVCVFIPILLACSLWEKKARQEPVLVEKFGGEYLEYRRRTPFFIPRIKDIPKILR